MHTHLFPGAEVRIACDAGSLARGEPTRLTIAFIDGSEVPAELLVDGADGATLWVEGYRTRAGTAISTTAWQVKGSEQGADGDLRFRVGVKLTG